MITGDAALGEIALGEIVDEATLSYISAYADALAEHSVEIVFLVEIDAVVVVGTAA